MSDTCPESPAMAHQNRSAVEICRSVASRRSLAIGSDARHEGTSYHCPSGLSAVVTSWERKRGRGGPNKTITMKTIRILAALAAMALLISACGSSAKESAADKFAQTAAQQAKTQATTPAATTPAPTAAKVSPSAGERDIATKPKIPKASG